MSSIQVNRITNANLYINGNNRLGRAEEINLGDVKMKMSEHKSLGMIGSIELPAGVDKISAKIKWNSFYADVLQDHNPYQAVQLQIRTNVETYASTGRTSEVPMVTFLTGFAKNFPLGNFKQHDNVEAETEFSITSVKQIMNGVTTFEYDALANIHKVSGVDINANYKQNTGA